jgi:hypothetical protein
MANAHVPDPSALVRLASITRVEGYKRRGDKGESERVSAYVRKVLDSFGGGNDKTKKGAFSTETGGAAPKGQQLADISGKRFADIKGKKLADTKGQKLADISGKGPGSSEKAAADLKADVEDYHGALTDALDGKDFEIPKYRTPFPEGQKAEMDPETAKQAITALKGTTDKEIKEAAEAVKQPKVKALIDKTPLPVIKESIKTMSANVKKYGRKALLVSFAVLMTDSEKLEKVADKAVKSFDWADNLANIISVTIPAFLPQMEGFLHMLGLSEESPMTELRLSSITRVKGYKRRGDGGKTEQVATHVRKNLDAAGFGSDKTKKGAFASQVSTNKDGSSAPDAKSSGDSAADLKADVVDYTNAMDKALDGEDFTIPKYRTASDSKGGGLTPDLAKQAAGALKGMTPEEGKEARAAVKKPKVKQLLEKTPLPVLAGAVKSMAANVKQHGAKMLAITFATLVVRQEKVEQGGEVLNAVVEASEPFHGVLEIVTELIHAAPEILEALEPILHSIGLSDEAEVESLLGLARQLSGRSDDGVELSIVTRVEAYKRRGISGKTEHVDSYIRRVLDSFGKGADADTKRAAFMKGIDALKAEHGVSGLDHDKVDQLAGHIHSGAFTKPKSLDAAPPKAKSMPASLRSGAGAAAAKNFTMPESLKKKRKVKASEPGAVAELEIRLAKGRLDWSPKKNWVENAGGLPKYIEDIALALIRDHGMTREHAIPVAINRVKKWAAGVGDVKPDTRAKAAAALAEWEALKAKSKGKTAAKKAAS